MKLILRVFSVLTLVTVIQGAAFDFEEDVHFANSSRYGRAWGFGGKSSSVPDVACNANAMGNNAMSGVCRTSKECQRQRGTVIPGSTCGGSNGVCCSISLTCPTNMNGNNVVTARQSGTHILSSNSNNMNSLNRGCEIRFPRPNKNICQVRLDFTTFTLPPPNGNGVCDVASFTVSAENLQDFIACGAATGQRLYLNYGDSDTVTANFNLNSNNGANVMPMPNFDLFATHIPCATVANSKGRKGRSFFNGNSNNNNNKNNNNNDNEDDNVNDIDNEPAPNGCDQYYTSSSGEIRSFNYIRPDNTNNAVQSQISSERYTVCIRTPPGSKRIIWQTCTNEVFFISGGLGDEPSRTGNECSLDYVDIPGSPSGRYCGGAFPDTVLSTARPFLMYVHLDDQEDIPFDQNIINPLTGCPAGYNCAVQGSVITPGAPAPFPGATLPCGSPEAITAGAYCTPEDGFADLFDFNNAGFCLKYTVV